MSIAPLQTDAAVRLKNNAVVFITLCTLTTLLPTPSPASALLTVLLRRTVSDGVWIFSIAESVLLGVLLANIAQAAFALRYPSKVAAVPRTAKSSATVRPTDSPSPVLRRLVSPDSAFASPSEQKSFSMSTSTAPGQYAASPLSTPSRTMQYTMSPQAPFDTSISSIANTSLSVSVPPSPSPATSSPMPMLRGLNSIGPARSLDASIFRRLERERPIFAQADD